MNTNQINRVWVVASSNSRVGSYMFRTRQMARTWRRNLKAKHRASTRIVKFVRSKFM